MVNSYHRNVVLLGSVFASYSSVFEVRSFDEVINVELLDCLVV